MSEKLETLIEQLGKLTVVEALELSKKLEEAWGVSATVGASAPAAGGAPVEEKAEVDVILTGYNDNLVLFDKYVSQRAINCQLIGPNGINSCIWRTNL